MLLLTSPILRLSDQSPYRPLNLSITYYILEKVILQVLKVGTSSHSTLTSSLALSVNLHTEENLKVKNSTYLGGISKIDIV